MESTGGSRPGLCVRCAKSTHWWSDPHTGGRIRTPEAGSAHRNHWEPPAPAADHRTLRRLVTLARPRARESARTHVVACPTLCYNDVLKCDAADQIGICPSDPEQAPRGRSALMEHRQDHPGNRPPGPHPSEEIPPSEVLAQRRAFLEISDADVEQVRGLAGLFDSFLDGYIKQFYAHLVAHPVTASFLTDPTLVPCLKQAQKRYFESLLRARLDADYVVDRQRIGQVHADVGLEPPLFLGAYNQYLQYTFRQFAAHCGGDLECYVEGTLALLKLLLLDMGLALDPYFARSTEHLR